MPYKIRRVKKGRFQVVNSQTGEGVGKPHPSKADARSHLKALYANTDAAEKFFNPAEHRVPGGMGPGGGGGRFAPGQVTDRQKPTRGERQALPPNVPRAGEGTGGPIEGGHGDRGSDHKEEQIRNAAREELAQAHEIEQQVHMFRAQIAWDKQEIAFQSGVGPPPSTPSPGVGRTQGAAGSVGSAPTPGATSGAVAQQFTHTVPGTTASQQYIQFLRNDIATLQVQARQLEHNAEQLTDHAHSLLASIRGKTHSVPDITITAKALQELINSYNQIG